MTSAPISADAATTAKIVGVNKTITLVKGTVTGLTKAEKKVVKVSKNSKTKKVTVKGLKAGKVTFKIGKKAYTVKVGATKVTATATIPTSCSRAADGVIRITANATDFTVGGKAVKSVDVLGVYKTNGTTPVKVDSIDTSVTAANYAILLTAYDQYGNKFNTGFTAGNITITPSGDIGLSAGTITTCTVDGVSSFEVADVAQIYTGTFASDGTYQADGTDQALTVTGKVGSTVVSLDKADFTIIGSTHIAADNVNGKVKGGVVAVYKDSAKSEFGTANEEIEVIINNKKGTSIKKSVAVSSIAPAVASVTRTSAAFAVASNTVASTAVNASTLLTLKDQYGQDVANDTTSPRILYTNIPDALSVTNNNTTTASLSGSTAGTYYLGITVAGVTEFVTISVGA